MANPNWVKGVSGNPKGKPKGALNKTTLDKLAARARFEEKASQKWDEVVDALLKQNPVYVADQMMGKAPDKREHTFPDKKPLSEATIEKIDSIMLDDDE